MHYVASFNGPLSDIYLGPYRETGVKFYIPRPIREDRRILWMAATLVQTTYRRVLKRRIYLTTRQQSIKIQSLLRMYPKWNKFQRLKETTIKCQAWIRRTLTRHWYLRLREAVIVIQKYVRRYLAVTWRDRTLRRYWRSEEAILNAIIVLQCE